MKNKACLASLLSLLSFAAFAGNDNATVKTIVYHGQLIDSLTGEPTTFHTGAKKNLTFSGYASEQSGAKDVWHTDVKNVPINPDGSFIASFGDEDLGGHIATGAVTHIGMRIKGAVADMGTPRALRPVVSVNRALVAEGLAADAKIGTFVTSGATANDLDVAGAEIAGPIVTEQGGSVSVRPFTAEAGVTKIERGKGVKVWGTPTNLVANAENVKGGVGLVKDGAPSDGVALIHCSGDEVGRTIRIPGTVQFCRAGDEILAPAADSGKISVTFWPYAK